MEDQDGKPCVECGGGTEPIKIVDATQPGFALGVPKETGPGSHHIQLQYTADDAKRETWLARFPTTGFLRGRLCTQCGRVALYAIPRNA